MADPPQISRLRASSLFRSATWIGRNRKMSRLRRENERLRREAERLKQETERCAGNWKQHCVPANVRRLHIRGATRKSIRSGQVVSQGAATAARHAAPSHREWMNRSRFHCRSTARIAAAAWSRKAAKHSIRKRLSGEP